MNNFQRLEEEELERLPDLPLGIAHNVNSTLGGFRTFGNVIDLYITKIVDVFVMMTGGTVDRPNNNYRQGGDSGTPTDPDQGIPGGPSEG